MDLEESRKTSDRIAINKERNAMEGRFHGGRRPYGYTRDGMTVIEEEADSGSAHLARSFLAGQSPSLASPATSTPGGYRPRQATSGLPPGCGYCSPRPGSSGNASTGWETGDDGKPTTSGDRSSASAMPPGRPCSAATTGPGSGPKCCPGRMAGRTRPKFPAHRDRLAATDAASLLGGGLTPPASPGGSRLYRVCRHAPHAHRMRAA